MKRLFLGLFACLPLIANAQDGEANERLRAAEQRLEAAAREIAELSSELAGESLQHVFRTEHRSGEDRAMLGINVGRIQIRREDGSTEERGYRGDGVEIYGVTPGGPADEAGLESGDIIVSLNGTNLAADGSPPERRLIQLMRAVEPGAPVQIGYRRADEERAAEIVTREFEPMAFAFGAGNDFDLVVNGEQVGPGMLGHLPGFAQFHRRGAWRGLELVPLTPGLGSYFGSDTGLLVIREPDDANLSLQEGDVILRIAGATPETPPEAMRLLRFYEPGDQLVMEVLRQKRNRTFKVTVPQPQER